MKPAAKAEAAAVTATGTEGTSATHWMKNQVPEMAATMVRGVRSAAAKRRMALMLLITACMDDNLPEALKRIEFSILSWM
ncbi:MAG TPA: hypothetical protein DCR27_03340 [Lachnospiraceae bacterium]|nr:hypothetical protein [Lachnospiraceae bacterium]